MALLFVNARLQGLEISCNVIAKTPHLRTGVEQTTHLPKVPKNSKVFHEING